jgi:hypothetical protein
LINPGSQKHENKGKIDSLDVNAQFAATFGTAIKGCSSLSNRMAIPESSRYRKAREA